MNNAIQLSELVHTHDLAIEYFMPIFNEGYENQRFRRGKHWTDKEIKAHRKEKRHPYAITLTATKFNRHLAEQRANRTGWKANGRGEEDELQAELDTQVFKYTEDINKFKWTESEIYEDALGKKIGHLYIATDYDKDIRGDVKLKRWKWDQVVWDINSVAYDLNEDCGFIDRFEWYNRETVLQMYPEKKDVIKLTRADFENDTSIKRKLSNYYFNDKGKDKIKVIWRQQKEYKKEWKVIPLVPDMEVMTFDTMKDAEAYVNQQALTALGLQQGQPMPILTPEMLVMMEGVKKNFKIDDRIGVRIREICFTGNDILEDELIDWTDKYTVIPYFALKDDEYIFNLIDLVKDPQRGFDRLFSMIDKSIAKNIKGNNYSVNESKVRPEVLAAMDKHMKGLVEGGYLFPVLADDAIKEISKTNNIQVEMTLIGLMQGLIEDLMGGNTFAGLESKTKQTATEASILEKAARLGTFLFIDNLMRWKQIAGEVLYDCILNTYTYEMKLNIAGEALTKKIQEALAVEGLFKMSDNYESQGYLTYNKGGKRLRQNKMNVMVSEVEMSDTTRALQYEQLKGYSAEMVTAGGMPISPELLLSSSNLPATIKSQLQKDYEEQKVAMAEEKARTDRLEEIAALGSVQTQLDGIINKPEENGKGTTAKNKR